MAERPKVVIIGPVPPPYQGMSIFTRQLLDSAVLGAAYEVLHLDTADRRSVENMGRFDLENVRLALRHSAGLWRLLRRHRPELVYVEVSQNALAYLRDSVFIYLAHALGSRVVTHLHGSHFREFYDGASWWCRWLIRSTSRRLAAAAVLGPGLRGLYAGLVPEEKVHSVPNGIEDPFAGRGDRSGGGVGNVRGDVGAGGGSHGVEGVRGKDGGRGEEAADTEATVLYLGLLYEPKGFLDLLRAAALVRNRGRSVRFTFAGEWFSEWERREAGRLVDELGLEGVVSFVGRVNGAAKWSLLESVDMLVFPGYQPEGMPLVILEAMAASLPVISTTTGAIGDVVVDGATGLLVPSRDPASLAAAIERLVDSAELRGELGRAGRARFLEEFTEERSTQRLVRLFDIVRGAAATPEAEVAGAVQGVAGDEGAGAARGVDSNEGAADTRSIAGIG